MKITAFTIFYLLLLVGLHAQENMQQGHYIDNNDKRVDGYFKIKTSTSYSKKVLFDRKRNEAVRQLLSTV
jgi:hypothetical protein